MTTPELVIVAEWACNQAKTLIPRVREASQKVSRAQYPTLNSITAEDGMGDPDVARLRIAANSLIYVYAHVLAGGTLNEADMKRAADILNAAWGQGRIDRALDQIEIEINAAAKQGLGKASKECSGEEFFTEPMIVGEWPSNSRGDIGRVSIEFFKGTCAIYLFRWFEDDGQMIPGKGNLIAISVKNLPTFAEVMARAVAFARERGLIEAAYDNQAPQAKKESAEDRSCRETIAS